MELMYAKFQAGIWEALSKRYTDVDMAQVSPPLHVLMSRAQQLLSVMLFTTPSPLEVGCCL